MTMPELRERSSWMVALCSDLFWMTNVTLSSATSLYTSTLLAPRTLVGEESHCIAHLVTDFSSSSPGDLSAETARLENGWDEDTVTWKQLDSSWTRWGLYPMVCRVTLSSASSPPLSSASMWCRVRKPSSVSSPCSSGKLATTTAHSSSDTSSPLVRQLKRLNSVLDNVPFPSRSALLNMSARTF